MNSELVREGWGYFVRACRKLINNLLDLWAEKMLKYNGGKDT